jgi:hypothetical protein
MTRLYDAPFGQVQEFLKRLAVAGFTQEEMVRLTNDPVLMKTWVSSLQERQNETADSTTNNVRPDTPVEAMFDSRMVLLLHNSGIETIGHLVDWTEGELRDVRGCGDYRIKTIKAVLSTQGLKLANRSEDVTGNDRIWSRNSIHPYFPARPWLRRDIGHLQLSLFGDFGLRRGEFNNIRRLTISYLASLSDEEIIEEIGEVRGRRVTTWIDENYRPWIG